MHELFVDYRRYNNGRATAAYSTAAALGSRYDFVTLSVTNISGVLLDLTGG
jgi:hypothetical protein